MIQIITDSTSDLILEQALAWNVKVMPITVHFGEAGYLDRASITAEEFYEKLAACGDALPTTSQINPAEFSEAFESALDQGNDVIGIFISSELSGTYQSAVIAKELLDSDRIYLVDSRTTTFALGLLVRQAVKLRDEGLNAAQIAERLDKLALRLRLYAVVDTLKYLKLGGRISAATAFAGGLLSIKPVIAVEDGLVAMKGKARGSKQGNNLLRQLVEECGGIDFQKPFALAYSGLSDKLLQKYIDDSGELWQGNRQDLPYAMIGSVVGTHAGPGAVAVAFFEP